MMILATIGPTGLYLLFIWLLSAAIGSWVSDRKGYGEKVGLTFGLLLSAIGLLIVLILPGRPGSIWKVEGPIPKRGDQHLMAVTEAGGPRLAAGPDEPGEQDAAPGTDSGEQPDGPPPV
jgi:hypothetical protein